MSTTTLFNNVAALTKSQAANEYSGIRESDRRAAQASKAARMTPPFDSPPLDGKVSQAPREVAANTGRFSTKFLRAIWIIALVISLAALITLCVVAPPSILIFMILLMTTLVSGSTGISLLTADLAWNIFKP